LKRTVVIKFNPQINSTLFIFADFEKNMERVIFCSDSTETDSDWVPFDGKRIQKENLLSSTNVKMKITNTTLAWLVGETETLHLL
jgi:hypothetical protein